MRKNIKGFPAYGFSTIVKFGGSLMRDPIACKSLIAEFERMPLLGEHLLIVPGGGLPDKAIEAIDADDPLSPFTAHHACGLAQDQTGYLLADPAFSSKLVVSSALGECRRLTQQGSIPVLLPSRILFAMDPVEWSWDITSDAVAAWIAWVTGTPRLVVLTDVDGVYRNAEESHLSDFIETISAGELARLGHTSVDACAAEFMAFHGLTGAVINGRHPHRFSDWVEGKKVRATEITMSDCDVPVGAPLTLGVI